VFEISFVGCLIIIVAAIIELVAPNIGGFIGGRVVIGMGAGISMAAGPTFMSEITPQDIRGRMLSFWQIAYSVGALVCTYIALGTSYCTYYYFSKKKKMHFLYSLTFINIIMHRY
jgi:MFS family permease